MPLTQGQADELAQYSTSAYRRARWHAIDRARASGATWREIGAALDMDAGGALRAYERDAPSDNQARDS